MSDRPNTGMIWTDPREMMSSDYYVHPIEHSDASYKPVWHSVQAAKRRPMTDGGATRSADVEVRDGSRLEVDDPEHCKECGGEIQYDDFHAHDAQGRPMVYIDGDEGHEWISLERCADCWAEQKVEELASECMDRYGGALAEVLDV